MACNITAGRLKVCKDSVGGSKKAFIFNYVEDAFTVVAGVATAINPLLTQVFEFELEGDGNTYGQNKPSDRNNGTSINTQTLTLILKKMDAATSAEMNLLTAGYPMAVIQDRNGEYLVIGLDDGLDFTVDSSTGGAKSDLNGYTLTGVATTKDMAPHLDTATISAFLALVA
jgi:hypothetical protein